MRRFICIDCCKMYTFDATRVENAVECGESILSCFIEMSPSY
jgi:hypothetical protein